MTISVPAVAGLMGQLDRQEVTAAAQYCRPQLQEVQVGTAGLTWPNLKEVTATSHGRPPQVQEGQVVARKAQVVGQVEMFHQED